MNILRQVSVSLLSSNHSILWWETDSLEVEGHGLHVQIFGELSSKFYPAVTTRVIRADNTRSSFHRVELRGLTPGAPVSVRVAGPSFLQPGFSSVSPPHTTQPINLAVIGSAEGNLTGLSEALGYDESINGVLSVGGFMPTHSVSVEDVSDFLDVVGDSLSSLTFVCATSRDNSNTDMSVFKTYPANRRYFVTTVGPVAVMCLDTSKAGRRTLADEQSAWALDVFASDLWKSASYRVVLSASIFRTSVWDSSASFGNGTGVDPYLQSRLLPVLKQSGASLVICGEAKSYQHGSIESSYPSIRGATTDYITCGGIPPTHDTTAWDHQPHEEPSIFVEATRPHLVRLMVTPQSMIMSCVDTADDSLIDYLAIAPSTL